MLAETHGEDGAALGQDGVQMGEASSPIPPFTGYIVLSADERAGEVLAVLKEERASAGFRFETIDTREELPEGAWVVLISADMGPGKPAGLSMTGRNKKTGDDLSVEGAHKTIVFNIGLWKAARPVSRDEDLPAAKMARKILQAIEK